MKRLKVYALSSLVFCAAACGRPVDLAAALRLESVATGWFEASAAEGQIKLVPAIAFKLRNASDQTLHTLQVNAIFRRVTEDTEWGSGYRTVAGSAGLPPSSATDRVFVASTLGYTGTESRFEMLRNSHFVDARVGVFARDGSQPWTKIADFVIARELIEQ